MQYEVTWKVTQTFWRTITAETEEQAAEYARGFSITQLNDGTAHKAPRRVEVVDVKPVKVCPVCEDSACETKSMECGR